jgi:hypothetical protein
MSARERAKGAAFERQVIAVMRDITRGRMASCHIKAPAALERSGADTEGIAPMSDESTTPDLTPCVLHTGRVDRDGYGRVGRGATAHRTAWVAAHGPVPVGLELHHTCENPACVNADHLLPVTSKQHHALHLSTHCPHGHPFDAENTYARSDYPGRQCRTCKRAAMARYRKAKAA